MRSDPFTIAKEILIERYPGAAVAFVAGSFNRGEATDSSDIDLVVIFDRVDFARRESFFFADWPVEVFVHDPETLNYFFREVDAKGGIPKLPCMVLEGKAIPENHELNFKLKSLADQVIDAGPPRWANETIYHQRYAITDLVDDIRAPRNEFESRILIGALHDYLGNFYFRAKGMWSASTKQLPRRILKIDPLFAAKWFKAFEEAYSGEHERLIALVEEVLRPYGGLLFGGYSRAAAKNWRLPIQDKDEASESTALQPNLLPEEKTLTHPKLGTLHLRWADKSDAAKIRQLLNSAYAKLLALGLNYSASFQDDQRTIEELKLGGSVLVVERGSEIIATMKIRDFNRNDEKKCLYISRFAVRPDLQKFGLGSLLLKLAERIARRESYVCMQLDTAQQARHLIDYYQSQGFKIARHIYYEGKTYTSWILEKMI